VRLAVRLDREAAKSGRKLPVLLEFNVGGEPTKGGWDASDESTWPGLLPDVAAILELRCLAVRGLMTMPPMATEPEASRPFFVRLRRLRDFMHDSFPRGEWAELSAGTSHDFEVAIEEGATYVRIGTAILGSRE